MLNVASFTDGVGGGVLIRAIEPLVGVPCSTVTEKKKGNGPGKLCKLLGLKKKAFNDMDMTLPDASKIYYLFNLGLKGFP